MSVGDVRLASAGDDVKLWNCNGFTLIKQFNPHNHNVASLCWAHDNTSLASASTSGDKIVLTYSGASAYSYDLAVGEGRQCITFNSTSRYIMGGGPDGHIHVWDLKTYKLKKSYRDHKAAVTSVQFNWNDTSIASGSEKGEILLYNVVSGVASSPMIMPKRQAVRQLQYSHFKKSLLAACSDSGAVALFDTNKRQLIHAFTDSHKAPAMGLAFSPLNEMLLMSVGLDKRIVCYDVQNKQPVKTMIAESPLTSIDLMHDGATLAAGSTRGKIYIYDLRQGASPITTLSAHKSSVQCLKFMNNFDPSAKSKPSSALKKSSNLNSTSSSVKSHTNGVDHLPAERGYRPTQTPSPAAASVREREGDGYSATEVFSPIRDRLLEKFNQRSRNEISLLRRATTPGPPRSSGVRDVNSPSGVEKYSERLVDRRAITPGPKSQQLAAPGAAAAAAAGGENLLDGRLDGTGKSNHSYDGIEDNVFSPLHDGTNIRSHPIGRAADVSPSFVTSRTFTPGLTNDEHPTQLPPYRDEGPVANNLNNDHVPTNQFSHKTSPESNETPVASTNNHHHEPAPSQPLSFPQMPAARSPSRRSASPQSMRRSTPSRLVATTSMPSIPNITVDSPKYPATTPDGAVPSGAGAMSAAVAAVGGGGAGEGASEPSQLAGQGGGSMTSFQAAFLRQLVRDEVEEVRDQLRQDVLNLHMDLLKQFQIQQAETRAMLQMYSVNDELMAEIHRLREENKRLKKMF